MRSAIEPPNIYDKLPLLSCVESSLRMDFSRIISKPLLVKQIAWTTTDALFKVEEILSFPGSLLTVNPMLAFPFNASCYYRGTPVFYFQVTGTPMHQGTLLVSATPTSTFASKLTYGDDAPVASLMSAPHVFLSPNNSTTACLTLPFYSGVKLHPSPFADLSAGVSKIVYDDFGYLNMVVLNPLAGPSTASTTVYINVYVDMRQMEFYVPSVNSVLMTIPQGFQSVVSSSLDSLFSGVKNLTGDLIDEGRSLVRKYTGLHNPNIGYVKSRVVTTVVNHPNTVDAPQHFETLHPYCIDTPITDDYYFTTDVDEMSISHIMGKPQYVGTFSVKNDVVPGSILWSRAMAPFSPRFTDSGRYTFRNPMDVLYANSLFWRGSITIHIQSSMSSFHFVKLALQCRYNLLYNAGTKASNVALGSSAPTTYLEFSNGGQVQSVTIPYCRPNDYTRCVLDLPTLLALNGAYTIYNTTPLMVNGSAVDTVHFNVFMSCEPDILLAGYATDTFEAQGSEVPLQIPTQNDILNKDTIQVKPFMSQIRPNLSVRDYMRRMVLLYTGLEKPLSTSKGEVIMFPLGMLFDFFKSAEIDSISTHGALRRMFVGFRGGFKVRIEVSGAARTRIVYAPPYSLVNTTNGEFLSPDAFPGGTDTAFDNEVTNRLVIVPSNYTKPSSFFQGPFQSDTSRTTSSTYMSVSSNVTDKLSGDTSIHEFTIPVLTEYTHIGVCESYSTSDSQAHDDYGMLYIIVEPGFSASSNTPYIYNVTAYGGITDESRLGFQSYCYPTRSEKMVVESGPRAGTYTPSVNVVKTSQTYFPKYDVPSSRAAAFGGKVIA